MNQEIDNNLLADCFKGCNEGRVYKQQQGA